jgi:predicted RNA-binding Zn ribbon-like protein
MVNPRFTHDMHPANMPPVGGALCLDFCNTVNWPGTAREEDWFADEAGFAGWCGALALPVPQRPMLAAALALRGATWRAFAARAGGTAPAEADLRAIWSSYGAAIAGAALIADGTVAGVVLPADDPLAPVVCSAVELLCEPALPVKLCRTHQCGWLFIDQTKNRGRQFCNLRCGNRVRARNHYARMKSDQP